MEANQDGASDANVVQDTSSEADIAQRIGNVLNRGNEDGNINEGTEPQRDGLQEHRDTPQGSEGQEDSRSGEEQDAGQSEEQVRQSQGDGSSREDKLREDGQSQDELLEEENSEEVEASADTDSEASEEPKAEEDTFKSLEELQEATEMEDFFETITAKVKVDGVEEEVKLSEALSGYQRDADYRRKTMDLAEEKKSFEVEKQSQVEDLQTRLQDTGKLVQYLEQEIIGDANDPTLAELRHSDPTEWNARQIELNARQDRLRQYKEYYENQTALTQQETQQKLESQQLEYLEEQKKQLISAVPKWSNQEAADKDFKEISEYMSSNNFTGDEISSIVDHRHVLLIKKALEFDKLSKSKKEVKLKKVNKLPKVVKSSGTADVKQTKGKALKDAKARLRKSGKTSDAEAALAHLFNQ